MRPAEYVILVAELTDDPFGAGFAAMSDTQVATALNSEVRNRAVDTVAGQEILEACAPAEYAAQSTANKALLHSIFSMATVQVSGTNTKAALFAMFNSESTTRANLIALATEKISRATELGLPVITEGHVGSARIKMGV